MLSNQESFQGFQLGVFNKEELEQDLVHKTLPGYKAPIFTKVIAAQYVLNRTSRFVSQTENDRRRRSSKFGVSAKDIKALCTPCASTSFRDSPLSLRSSKWRW
eukprot:2779894-Ditylum_brightwellii.AAC.1